MRVCVCVFHRTENYRCRSDSTVSWAKDSSPFTCVLVVFVYFDVFFYVSKMIKTIVIFKAQTHIFTSHTWPTKIDLNPRAQTWQLSLKLSCKHPKWPPTEIYQIRWMNRFRDAFAFEYFRKVYKCIQFLFHFCFHPDNSCCLPFLWLHLDHCAWHVSAFQSPSVPQKWTTFRVHS